MSASPAAEPTQADTEAASTLVRVGDRMPELGADAPLVWPALRESGPAPPPRGGSLGGLVRGRVCVFWFFTTWCGSCQRLFPLLERQLWQRWGALPQFALVGVGREHTPPELAAYAAQNGLTFPFVSDLKREVQ